MLPTASALLNRLLARGKFRHVQVLLKLAQLGSVQRTATAVGMTQSSVTQSLAYIEGLLETSLFQRHARGVRPTALCNELVPVLRQLMQGMTQGAELVAAFQRRGEGVVRLVASGSAINGLLEAALVQFARRVPALEVHLREAEAEELLLAIAQGEVDLMVCRRPESAPEGWHFVPLLDDQLVVTCGPRHPLAQRRRVGEAELAHHGWVLAPAGSLARERFDAMAATWSAAPRTLPLVTRNMTLLVRLMQEHEALTLLPLSFVRQRLARGDIRVVKGAPAHPLRPIGLLQPAAMSEAAARLASFLVKAADTPRRARA